ncbi:MAG: hypothetical protein E7036_00770 [Opitutales bacterium]|nr:hypothetical protein [Opitutales bacterium]
MEYTGKYVLQKVVNTLTACTIFCAYTTTTNLFATEIMAGKADTFISQAMPKGEFSKSEFLAISRDANEKTITYIPFEFDAQHIGIQPTRDRINDATLTLFVKSFPSMPKSNAIGSDGTPNVSTTLTEDSPDVSAKKIQENVQDKIDSAEDTVIRIEVYGVIDDETLTADSKHFRFSWDGKHDAPAPKHNTMDDQLEKGGITKLGTIEIDISKDDYDDGDRVEFKSDELTDYLNFCYGITIAREETPKFNSSLEYIRNATFILRQESGPSAILFYSADSLGEESDKQESGEISKEQKAKDEKEEEISSPNILPRDAKEQEKLLKKERAKEIKEVEKIVAKKMESKDEHLQFSLIHDVPTDSDDEKSDKQQEKKGNQPDNEEQKPDLRPRINFEFRADTIDQ